MTKRTWNLNSSLTVGQQYPADVNGSATDGGHGQVVLEAPLAPNTAVTGYDGNGLKVAAGQNHSGGSLALFCIASNGQDPLQFPVWTGYVGFWFYTGEANTDAWGFGNAVWGMYEWVKWTGTAFVAGSYSSGAYNGTDTSISMPANSWYQIRFKINESDVGAYEWEYMRKHGPTYIYNDSGVLLDSVYPPVPALHVPPLGSQQLYIGLTTAEDPARSGTIDKIEYDPDVPVPVYAPLGTKSTGVITK